MDVGLSDSFNIQRRGKMIFRKMIYVFFALSLFGCATPNMKLSQTSNMSIAVKQDKALIYFIRPEPLGYLINAAVYDGEEFIGFIPYKKRLPYFASPGEHRFMVISEAADFMDANVLSGKTYYVQVFPRMGAWRARFSLGPITKEELQIDKVKTWINESQLIENKPEAYEWAKENRASVLEKKEAYLKKWLEKDRAKQRFLEPDDAL
ncbi:MAG: hypothetical protein HZA11_00620 [Nitrospirae bacterium]|nr:hypothetical protein [Nitrospirota bacterium]